jgi:hypothetical protein
MQYIYPYEAEQRKLKPGRGASGVLCRTRVDTEERVAPTQQVVDRDLVVEWSRWRTYDFLSC